MKLWNGNRIDGEWELSNAEIIRRFEASNWIDASWSWERSLRLFLTGNADGALDSTFEESDFAVLREALHDHRQAARRAANR